MRSYPATLLAAALTLAPLAASAQSTQLRFDGVNGAQAYGYFIGPYNGTLLRPGTAAGLTIFCVDFLNEVTFGESRPVNVTSLASSSLADTRHPGDVVEYRKAAWLSDQFATSSQNAWGGIQAAIWEIFAPGAPDGGTSPVSATDEAYWTQQADDFAGSTAYATYDWQRFHVITDASAAGQASGGMQEFITASPNVVPEPTTWALLGGGLAGIGLVTWTRKRQG